MPTNFDPRHQDDGEGDGRRSLRPHLVEPRRTTSARASASPTRCDQKTVVRGGYGISYVHFHRAGGGNLLPINGPQVINAVVNPDQPAGPRPSGPPSRAIRPG